MESRPDASPGRSGVQVRDESANADEIAPQPLRRHCNQATAGDADRVTDVTPRPRAARATRGADRKEIGAMSNITDHRIVSHEEWIAERKALLAKEKEFNRLRDELSARRRDLPWERVTKK